MAEVLPIGRRVCRDCRSALPQGLMYRCGRCLQARIDKIRKEHRK